MPKELQIVPCRQAETAAAAVEAGPLRRCDERHSRMAEAAGDENVHDPVEIGFGEFDDAMDPRRIRDEGGELAEVEPRPNRRRFDQVKLCDGYFSWHFDPGFGALIETRHGRQDHAMTLVASAARRFIAFKAVIAFDAVAAFRNRSVDTW